MQLKFSWILALFIAFQLFFYNCINESFKVVKETKLVEMSLPAETHKLLMGPESVTLKKGNDGDSVCITGWVLKKEAGEKKKDVYLVLTSSKDTLVFAPANCDLPRPDENKYFNFKGDFDTHGFDVSLPLSLLNAKIYHLGFVIEDKGGRCFAMSGKALSISDNTVALTDFKPEEKAKFKSLQVKINLKEATGNIMFNVDSINVTENKITITGWGFLKGMNTDSQKSYLLLRKNKKVTIFSVKVSLRQDVTAYFRKAMLNFDSAGYYAEIPTENLEKGRYQIGLYVEKGDQTAIAYSDKYADIGR